MLNLTFVHSYIIAKLVRKCLPLFYSAVLPVLSVYRVAHPLCLLRH